MITTNIVWDHRGRTAKGAAGPVEVRVTIDRKPYYINTGVKVTKSRLVGGIICDDDGSNDAGLLNERVRLVAARVMTVINNCLKEGKKVDVGDIRRQVWYDISGRSQDATSILEWIAEQVPMMGISAGRQKHYSTLRTRLMEFGQMQQWSDLSVEMIYRWDAWLHGLRIKPSENQANAGVKPRPLEQSAVYNYHKNLKAIFNRAVKLGVIDANPYDRMRGVFRHGDKEKIDYLTREQMQVIENLDLKPGTQLAMARDIFVFQAYTGLSYGDTQVFNMKDYREVDGRWVNIGQRIKTGVAFVSQLLPQAVAVLERNSMNVPKMNNQKYNSVLKKIGDMAGVSGLHSHMARHTFATWMLSLGAKIENVSRMLGHTNIKQTQRYAKVLAESVYDDYELARKDSEKNSSK